MLVTTFLTVLIIALVIGNILLSLLKPRQPEQAAEQTTLPTDETQGETHTAVFKSNPVFELAADKERINMLNKRIDKLEILLLKANGAPFLIKKLNGTKLGQKLNNLDEFKDNTKLEIAALKQEIARLKSQLGIQGKKTDDYLINNEKLHELVFHAGKDKG